MVFILGPLGAATGGKLSSNVIMQKFQIKCSLLLFSMIVVSCTITKEVNHNGELIFLESKDSKVTELCDQVHEKLDRSINWNKNVLVMLSSKNQDTTFVKITVFNKDDFAWWLRDNKEKPLGFFSYKNDPVIVFGESLESFFNKISKKETFEWFKAVPLPENNVLQIKPIFEPPVCNYQFINGEFYFLGISSFAI